MPVIVFINSIIAAGYQLGVVQAIIASFGRFLAWCLDTTPIESVNTAANVFMGLVRTATWTAKYGRLQLLAGEHPTLADRER